MSLESVAAMVESMVLLQEDQEEWAGSTVWQLSTDAVFRELQMWHLLFWMFWDISMRFRFVWDMRLTERLRQTSLRLQNSKRLNRY